LFLIHCLVVCFVFITLKLTGVINILLVSLYAANFCRPKTLLLPTKIVGLELLPYRSHTLFPSVKERFEECSLTRSGRVTGHKFRPGPISATGTVLHHTLSSMVTGLLARNASTPSTVTHNTNESSLRPAGNMTSYSDELLPW